MMTSGENTMSDMMLFEYEDGLLNEEQSTNIEKQLKESESGRNRLNEYRKSLSAVKEGFSQSPAATIPSIEAIIHRKRRTQLRKYLTTSLESLAAACIVLTAVWASSEWNNPQPNAGMASPNTEIASLKQRMVELNKQMSSLKIAMAIQKAQQLTVVLPSTKNEGTATILLTAAKHREESLNDINGALSRYREILKYYPETNAAMRARERIKALKV